MEEAPGKADNVAHILEGKSLLGDIRKFFLCVFVVSLFIDRYGAGWIGYVVLSWRTWTRLLAEGATQ